MTEELLPQLSPQGAPLGVAKRFRSTWIISSHQTLRASGLFEQYRASLSVAYGEQLLAIVAGVWLPIAVARAHYEACDHLGLSLEEQLGMGRAVGGGTRRGLCSERS